MFYLFGHLSLLLFHISNVLYPRGPKSPVRASHADLLPFAKFLAFSILSVSNPPFLYSYISIPSSLASLVSPILVLPLNIHSFSEAVLSWIREKED
jgi:hypothetical protein